MKHLKNGAQIIASVDDDNIPLDDWGKNIMIGKPTNVYYYESDEIAFDPIGVTNYPNLWHRGFPIQNLHNRSTKYKITRKTITRRDVAGTPRQAVHPSSVGFSVLFFWNIPTVACRR